MVAVGLVCGVVTEVGVGFALNLVEDDGAFDTGVEGNLADGGEQGLGHYLGAGLFVAAQGVGELGSGLAGADVSGAAAGHDAFLNSGAGGVQGILDAELLLLHLGFR